MTTKGRRAERRKFNRLEEIEMSANRLFKVTLAVVLVIVGLLALQPFAKATVASTANQADGQSRAQALLNYNLSERYGDVPQALLNSAAEQAAHEYRMHEWYGDVPQALLQSAAEQAAHEYRMRERYGETP
jgi:Tfp pilus assembly protein PilV